MRTRQILGIVFPLGLWEVRGYIMNINKNV